MFLSSQGRNVRCRQPRSSCFPIWLLEISLQRLNIHSWTSNKVTNGTSHPTAYSAATTGFDGVPRTTICTTAQGHQSRASFITISQWLYKNYGFCLIQRTWFLWLFLTFIAHQWGGGEVFVIFYTQNPSRAPIQGSKSSVFFWFSPSL